MIAQIRKKAGLTQRQLAEQMEITVQTVSNWETGLYKVELTPLKMLKLCKALGCSLEQLANEIEASDRQQSA